MTPRRASVGFYGVPGWPGRFSTKVHVHIEGVGPACGTRLRPAMEYQWCSWDNLSYVECLRCLRSRLARAMEAKRRALGEANIILMSTIPIEKEDSARMGVSKKSQVKVGAGS